MKKFFLAFIFVFSSLFLFSQEVTTINILNAQKTEYKKDPETGNETILLDGAVELSVTKGNVKTTVTSGKVSYDRVTKMLYAEGDVHMVSTGSAAGDENVTARSLILNTSTLEGVFDGGRVVQTKSDAINLPSGSTLVVFSHIFGKSESNILTFKNASMTFCDDEDPHWKINASRMWLLSGGEFAFLNAVLYVGPVPVLYLPAFYYPKNELVFNPVFGYRQREGYYVNTTAYLYGRKPLNTSGSISSSSDDDETKAALDSLYNFMKPSTLKEQKLEGIVLHNLDEDYKGNTSRYLKVIGDWYSNLGFLAGVEGDLLPEKGPFSKMSFALDLGFSNTIFRNGGYYTNISSAGQKYWDDSNFMGLSLPFRYRGDIEFALSKPIKISVSLPVYSDPYFTYDFLTERSENLNWISSVRELLEKGKDDDESITEVSSFTWQVTTGYSPNIPQVMKPFISSFSINTTSSLNISSISDRTLKDTYKDGWSSYTPRRRFYYPSQLTPVTANISLSGTLFQWPPASGSGKPKNQGTQLFTALSKPENLMTEEELKVLEEARLARENKEKEEAAINESEGEAEDSEKAAPETKTEEKAEAVAAKEPQEAESAETERKVPFFEDNVTLPKLSYSLSSASAPEGFRYSLSYSANPSVTTQLSYASDGLDTADDFTWDRYRSFMYTVKSPVNLNSSLSYGGSFFSMSNKVSYQPVWQEHPVLSNDTSIGGYSESSANALRKTDYTAQKQDIVNSNSISFRPFAYLPVISETGLVWDTNIKVFRREFIGDEENPEYDNIWAEWDDDSISVNSLSLILATKELENRFKQSLTFSASLPPQNQKYSATLALVFPFVNMNFSAGIHSVEKSEGPDEWVKDPLQQSLSVSWKLLDSNMSLSESFNYNLEENNADSLKTSLSWKGLSLAYTMSYTNSYDFVNGSGWELAEGGKSFIPYSISASYTPSSRTFYRWKNRISVSPGLSTSLVADLIRPTNSYFTFTPALTFRLNEFLDITFSSTSRNSVIYRYAQDMLGSGGRIPGETNMFKDLLNSFRFDDESLRKASGFKLKSLNMSLSHELHDWKFKMSLKIEPRLVTDKVNGVTKKYYDFSPYLTIGVVWSPMEAIKTSIVDEYGEWQLE